MLGRQKWKKKKKKARLCSSQISGVVHLEEGRLGLWTEASRDSGARNVLLLGLSGGDMDVPFIVTH